MDSTTTAIRSLHREAARLTNRGERYLDAGVEIRVADRIGDRVRNVPGEPVRVFGAVFDTWTGRRVGPPVRPIRWWVSPKQLGAVLHQSPAQAIVMHGGEGAAKTNTLAKWIVLRALQNSQCAGGLTAPTNERLEIAMDHVREHAPEHWYTELKKRREIVFGWQVVLQCRGTYQQRKAGSRIQGYTWRFHGGDEVQDYESTVFGDIEARGRGAPGGRFYRLWTCTPKDEPRFRDRRNLWKSSPDFELRQLRGPDNPWISPEHWERMRRVLSVREAARRIDGADMGPELAVYPDLDRAVHVRKLPPGAVDVTDRVLRGYQSFVRRGGFFQMLVGWDPGVIYQTAVFLRCYMIDRVPTWFVVDELIEKQMSSNQFARQLRLYLQQHYGLEYEPDFGDSGQAKALVIRDPHGRGQGDTGPDVDYEARKAGLDVLPASKDQIPKRVRVEMVNRLLKPAAGPIRLYWLTKDGNIMHPIAEQTFLSFADSEKDDYGRIEAMAKNEDDSSHAACATGYALFPFERVEITEWTQQEARAA